MEIFYWTEVVLYLAKGKPVKKSCHVLKIWTKKILSTKKIVKNFNKKKSFKNFFLKKRKYYQIKTTVKIDEKIS